jgi:hypothetical protein
VETLVASKALEPEFFVMLSLKIILFWRRKRRVSRQPENDMRESLHPSLSLSLWFVFGGRQKDSRLLEKRELLKVEVRAAFLINSVRAGFSLERGREQLLGAKTKHKFGQMPYSEPPLEVCELHLSGGI